MQMACARTRTAPGWCAFEHQRWSTADANAPPPTAASRLVGVVAGEPPRGRVWHDVGQATPQRLRRAQAIDREQRFRLAAAGATPAAPDALFGARRRPATQSAPATTRTPARVAPGRADERTVRPRRVGRVGGRILRRATAKTRRFRPSVARGSRELDPVKVDHQHVQLAQIPFRRPRLVVSRDTSVRCPPARWTSGVASCPTRHAGRTLQGLRPEPRIPAVVKSWHAALLPSTNDEHARLSPSAPSSPPRVATAQPHPVRTHRSPEHTVAR